MLNQFQPKHSQQSCKYIRLEKNKQVTMQLQTKQQSQFLIEAMPLSAFFLRIG
jgi:hypothetical protein